MSGFVLIAILATGILHVDFGDRETCEAAKLWILRSGGNGTKAECFDIYSRQQE